ncbi:lysine--tRNA ligase, partial [Candidatus Berkelbacteria bacterium]|nr:lysine--tRNA ligase [Candidatus Berkelbacteria bacterium]
MEDTPTNKNEAQTRAEKLDALVRAGVNPFASKTRRQVPITDVKDKTGNQFWIAGRIASIRSHGKSTFIDLKDESETIQCYFKFDDLGKKNYDMLKLFDNGDFIEVHGEVFVTKMGEQTIHVDDFALLTKSLLPLPDVWSGLKDTELRFRKRFVDLNLNPDVKNNLKKRAH